MTVTNSPYKYAKVSLLVLELNKWQQLVYRHSTPLVLNLRTSGHLILKVSSTLYFWYAVYFVFCIRRYKYITGYKVTHFPQCIVLVPTDLIHIFATNYIFIFNYTQLCIELMAMLILHSWNRLALSFRWAGYGYTNTMLNKRAQRSVQNSILQLMSAGGDCDSILRPYLCYAFAPKCRKKYDHGILPCKSACKAVKVGWYEV